MSKIRGKERRKAIRLQAYHLAKYRPASSEKEQAQPILVALKDIGAGGVCLRTEEYLPVSTQIDLRINFPGLDYPISSIAKVVWIRQIGKTKRYEVGAQFINLEESVSKLIDEQVKLVYQRANKKIGLFRRFFTK